MDLFKIRNDFPFLKPKENGKPVIYFDNAATTQKPRQVLETINKFYSKYNAAINRSIHEAVNLVCYSLTQSTDKSIRLTAGDEIIITVSEHHSNFVPWQRLAETAGISVRIADISGDGLIDPERIRLFVTGETRLICCPHVSNVLGLVNPVAEIAKIAHDAGALFLVDGTQSVPHMKVDVKDIDCDFLTFSGQKMLAPSGTGALYGKRELLEKMPPFLSGGGMIREVSRERTTWNELPWKFEAGTPDVCGAVALAGATDPHSGEKLEGAIDYLGQIGMDNIHAYEQDLCRQLHSRKVGRTLRLSTYERFGDRRIGSR